MFELVAIILGFLIIIGGVAVYLNFQDDINYDYEDGKDRSRHWDDFD